jgi:hypothetical protein
MSRGFGWVVVMWPVVVAVGAGVAGGVVVGLWVGWWWQPWGAVVVVYVAGVVAELVRAWRRVE